MKWLAIFLLVATVSACSSNPKQKVEAPQGRGANWYQAARLGKIDDMVGVVKSGTYKWDGADINGVTALMVASRYGQVELVKRLIQEVPAREHVDRRDVDQQSALMYAVLGVANEVDKAKTVDVLLENGADPFLIDRFGFQVIRGMIDMGMIASLQKVQFTSEGSSRQCDRGTPKPGEIALSRYARKAGEVKIAEYLELQGCW